MEIAVSSIKEGQVFYAINLGSQFPEFKKFKANKTSGKQVKATEVSNRGWGIYERTLRSADWRFFSDFISARGIWVGSRLTPEVRRIERMLEQARKSIDEIMAKDDL